MIIRSFFLKSQTTHLLEKVLARMCCTCLFHATHLTSSIGWLLAPGVIRVPSLLTSQIIFTTRTRYHHWPGGSTEKVEVQSGDKSSVLVFEDHECIVLLLDQLGSISIVHRDYTPVSPLLSTPQVWYPLPSPKRPMSFVESLLHMKRCQTWHVTP